jgi:tetratricopeptide (TPR) repeat protein
LGVANHARSRCFGALSVASSFWRATLRIFASCALCGFFVGASLCAQQAGADWVAEVRHLAELQDWKGALRVLDREGNLRPNDVEVREWRARVLTWSGNLTQAEQEWNAVVKVAPRDPDNWLGVAALYRREGRLEEAERAIRRALELDPTRADLLSEYGRILRSEGDFREARSEFQKALTLDSGSDEARSGLLSVEGETKNELRIGQDEDQFNFVGPNNDEWVSLVTHWTPHWITSEAGSFYQRDGVGAGEYVGSVTRSQGHWGAFTVGGAVGHDNGVIPRSEAFFNYDRGWRVSEDRFLRAVEFSYGQHWYWYSTARILTLNGTTVVYLPHDWMWTLSLTGARSVFTGTTDDWKPSGMGRLNFPLAHWTTRSLSGNIFFAAGTEDFADIDQIGSFASQTYGGGLRFQFTPRQDVTAYSLYQKRTQDHTQTSYGISYGIRF